MPPSSQKRQSLFIPFIVLLLLAGALFWFFFIKQKALTSVPPATHSKSAHVLPTERPLAVPETPPVSQPTEPSAAQVPGGVIKEEPASATQLPLISPADLARAQEIVDAFYQHLDTQEYIKSRHLNGGSKTYFTNLLEKVLNTPPIVTRETDDLLTVLKNSTHFFRLLGKNDILLARDILKQENDKLEELMAAYSVLLTTPATAGTVTPTLPNGALDDYAAYFLNTMGGKLYLSRRSPEVRMLVNFYALQTIAQANESGNNRHGIQIQPALDLLIAEFASGGNLLRHKESYLDKLYAMKEKYQ